MGKARLAVGEVGTIQVHAQLKTASGYVQRPTSSNAKPARWRARVYYRSADGALHELSRYGASASAARLLVVVALDSREAANSTDSTENSVSFEIAGRAWVRRIERRESALSPRSVDEYRRAWFRYFDVPTSSLRGLTLAQVNDPQRLRACLTALADERGTGAAHTARKVLAGVLRAAVADGVLPHSALATVGQVKAQVPRASSRDIRRAMTREERDAVVAHADELVSRARDPRSQRKAQAVADLVAFLAGTGVRINEARNVRWAQIDLTTGRCHIDGTKSASADRMINLPGWLVARLQVRRRSVTGALVFPSPTHIGTEKVWDKSNSASAVRAVLDSAGLTWATSHSFRRTVATLLHRGGVPLADIASTLGHRDVVQTLRYYIARDYGGDKSGLAALL
jgi:integrase